MNLPDLTIASVRTAIAERNLNPVTLVEEFHKKIDDENPQLNAYLTLCKDRALAKAHDIQKIADRGDTLPPLAGVPIAVKDTMVMKGVRSTAGSKILDNFVSPYDCTVVKRLEEAGCIVLGKTNCDEFAMGSSNENSAYGPVRNPRDTSRVPGGSSGGSAAAVAANMAVAALGSDTGGSIRQPAAYCGVVGLLPTYGRVSRYGLVAFASSLDHIGPITKTVNDAAILLKHMAGRDEMDSTSSAVPVPNYEEEIGKPVRGLKIGVPMEYFGEGLDAEVRAAVENAIQMLVKAGCDVVQISLPHTEYAIPCYYIIAPAEASSNLARFDGVRYGYRSPDVTTLSEMYRRTRDEGFGAEVKRRIMLGTYALSAGYYDAYYRKAQQVRALLAQEFAKAFAVVDAIVCPTTPTPAFKLGEKTDDPVAMYLNDIYTVTADLVGIPGISVPCGESKEKLPVGLQILGKHFDEGTILRLAHAYEHARAAV
jgi:aspartyl-tRNA(Asn)/glutamyl-tRNA(Gln) amidotransferase subunit A